MESWLTQLEKKLPADGARFVGLPPLGQALLLSELMRRTHDPLMHKPLTLTQDDLAERYGGTAILIETR